MDRQDLVSCSLYSHDIPTVQFISNGVHVETQNRVKVEISDTYFYYRKEINLQT